jgi:response regulator of citrate/malate metabolism
VKTVLAPVLAEAAPADVSPVLLDLHMPDTHGFAGLFLMQSHFPAVPVAIISAQEDAGTIRRARTLVLRVSCPSR